jgi:hypothetical protein
MSTVNWRREGVGFEGGETIAEDIFGRVQIFEDVIGENVLSKRFPDVPGGVEFQAVGGRNTRRRLSGKVKFLAMCQPARSMIIT